MTTYAEQAACDKLCQYLADLGEGLDEYLQFKHHDALENEKNWKASLNRVLPNSGVGIDKVIDEIKQYLLPNASPIPKPGCSSFITTGASTTAILANLSGLVASPQRYSLTAFNYIEELSLNWMRDLFSLPTSMKGLYSSGGSVANLVALGAARQSAFEKLGSDPAQQGFHKACRIYASAACHRTVHRAAAVLGMGRASVVAIPTDEYGKMNVEALQNQLELDKQQINDLVQVAVVANAGTTDTGAIDPIKDISKLTNAYGIWLHIDGAYGLPGILDPNVSALYDGLDQADSVIVDPHKWLGAPVGIGATFVKDRALLSRAFSQGDADYLEGAFSHKKPQNSLDSFGIPYDDFGVELSAPSRGVVVWAILREIGKQGLQNRICRHNAMAKHLANRVKSHPDFELILEPTLSICCFRYAKAGTDNLDTINRQIHRQLVHNGNNMPSTTVVNGKLVIRPCFIGARTSWQYADALFDETISITKKMMNS